MTETVGNTNKNKIMEKRIQLNEAQLKRIIKEAVENVFNDNEPGQETQEKAQVPSGELEKRMAEVTKWYRKASFSNDIVKAQYCLDKLGTALNGLFKILEKECGAQHMEKVKPRGF